jgi:hypothetical protein
MDAGGAADESVILRTAKSCGPDAPTLASSVAEVSARRRWQTSPVTGESSKQPLKPSRAGMPGVPGATVVTNARAYYHYTRGCGCNGHPAFPTPFAGRIVHAQLGRVAPRECGSAFGICCLLNFEFIRVIPGCATWRRPGIHTPCRGYGFRAHRCAMPRNDGLLFIPCARIGHTSSVIDLPGSLPLLRPETSRNDGANQSAIEHRRERDKPWDRYRASRSST